MNVETITSTDEACQILYMYRSPLVIINSNQITIRMPADCRQLDGVDDWLQLDLSSLNSWADWNTGLFAPGPGEENGMYFISGLWSVYTCCGFRSVVVRRFYATVTVKGNKDVRETSWTRNN
jgi:hypothetical protein